MFKGRMFKGRMFKGRMFKGRMFKGRIFNAALSLSSRWRLALALQRLSWLRTPPLGAR